MCSGKLVQMSENSLCPQKIQSSKSVSTKRSGCLKVKIKRLCGIFAKTLAFIMWRLKNKGYQYVLHQSDLEVHKINI